jgi:hypothetical protein
LPPGFAAFAYLDVCEGYLAKIMPSELEIKKSFIINKIGILLAHEASFESQKNLKERVWKRKYLSGSQKTVRKPEAGFIAGKRTG